MAQMFQDSSFNFHLILRSCPEATTTLAGDPPEHLANRAAQLVPMARVLLSIPRLRLEA